MAGEIGQVIAVERQDDDRVLVSVPLVGFPRGFQLRAGDRVVLVLDSEGPAARPLVDSTVVREPVASGVSTLEVAGRVLETQSATVRNEQPPNSQRDAGDQVVFTVDNGNAQAREQVIAVRSVR